MKKFKQELKKLDPDNVCLLEIKERNVIGDDELNSRIEKIQESINNNNTALNSEAKEFKKGIDRDHFYFLGQVEKKEFKELRSEIQKLILGKLLKFEVVEHLDSYPFEYLYLFREKEIRHELSIAKKTFFLINGHNIKSYYLYYLGDDCQKEYVKLLIKNTTGVDINGNFVLLELSDIALRFGDPNRKVIVTSYQSNQDNVDSFISALTTNNMTGFNLENKFTISNINKSPMPIAEVKKYLMEEVSISKSRNSLNLYIIALFSGLISGGFCYLYDYISVFVSLVAISSILCLFFASRAIKKSDNWQGALLLLFVCSISLALSVFSGLFAANMLVLNRLNFRFVLLLISSLVCFGITFVIPSIASKCLIRRHQLADCINRGSNYKSQSNDLLNN